MVVNLIDENILNNLKEQMEIPTTPINYLNICSFFMVFLIPIILYYRYTTKKKRKDICLNHINDIKHYLD